MESRKRPNQKLRARRRVSGLASASPPPLLLESPKD